MDFQCHSSNVIVRLIVHALPLPFLLLAFPKHIHIIRSEEVGLGLCVKEIKENMGERIWWERKLGNCAGYENGPMDWTMCSREGNLLASCSGGSGEWPVSEKWSHYLHLNNQKLILWMPVLWINVKQSILFCFHSTIIDWRLVLCHVLL